MHQSALIAEVHDDDTWSGSSTEETHELARRALAEAPDDPIVLYRCLQLWNAYSTAVGTAYRGPDREAGRRLVEQALANAEHVLAQHDARTTMPLRVL